MIHSQRWSLVFPIVLCLCRTGAAAELEIAVVDDKTDEPCFARMHLKNAQGKTPTVPNVIAWKDHFIVPGRAILKLPAGKYTFELERGPEYRLRTGEFELRRGDADNKEVRMVRYVDMQRKGWWSGELHVHRPLADIESLMLAEDLHVAPVITWWNDRNEWKTKPLPKELLHQFDDDRYYHVMAGEDERQGGALLYFNLDQPLDIAGAAKEYPSPIDFLNVAKENPRVHVDLEKPFWLDAPTWIATGKIDSIGLAHNHMWRDGVLDGEAWGRARDKSLYPGTSGNGRWSTDIYYHVLNCGLRIPPSAGSASGVLPNAVGYNRVYVHCGDDFDYEKWFAGLKAGRVVVTNGPLLRPMCEGEPPGHVFSKGEGQDLELQITLNLSTRAPIDYLEVVQDGKVVHEVRLDQLAEARGELPKLKFDRSGWFLVRAVSTEPKTYRFASSGPWYVEADGGPRISKTSAQFFLDWVMDRARKLELADAAQRKEVLEYHRQARDYWEDLVARANAE